VCINCLIRNSSEHCRPLFTSVLADEGGTAPVNLDTGLGAVYEPIAPSGASGLGAIREPADFAGGVGTTANLLVGQTGYGTLGFNADSDWFRVNLTAGQTYEIRVHGMGMADLTDPYLRVRNSAGTLVAENDDSSSWDGANGTDSRLIFTASATGTFYLDIQSYNNAGSGDYVVSLVPRNAAGMVFTADEIAWQLINNFNESNGRSAAWNIGADNRLTVNITRLDADGQFLARNALRAWTDVTGIAFTEVTGAAEITFDDSDAGTRAYASWSNTGRTITSATVMMSRGWLDQFGTTLNSYSFETYIHEIGHALGLGHGGNYNGSASYGTDNYYLNDSVAWTIMSYMNANNDEFGGPNTFVNASFRYMLTPAMADILAVQYLYGDRGTAYAGNTTYGYGSNTGNAAIDGFTTLANGAGRTAMTIWDEGGVDMLNFSQYGGGQTIFLDDESFSSVIGGIANLAIARGVVIENAMGGGAADRITGNEVGNRLYGNNGSDTLDGGSGSDTLYGGLGADSLIGGDGFDYAAFDDAAHGSFVVALSTAANATLGTGPAAGDRFTGIEGLILGSGNDTAYGDAGDNYIYGLAGNDMIYGGLGADVMIGGGGFDYARYDDANYGDIVVSMNNAANLALGTGPANDDQFFEIEGLILGDGNDWAFGDTAGNYIYGLGGNDNLFGSIGADLLDGGAGLDYARYDDAVYASLVADLAGANANTGAAAGDIYIEIEGLILTGNADMGFGTDGFNYLYGLGGNDTLNGRGGDDYLDGGVGNDQLTGGTGLDIFQHRGVGYGADTVTDFVGGTGASDRVNLQGMGFASFAAVIANSVQVGANLEIRSNATDKLVLLNFSVSNLAADDVII
jgi:serralysin